MPAGGLTHHTGSRARLALRHSPAPRTAVRCPPVCRSRTGTLRSCCPATCSASSGRVWCLPDSRTNHSRPLENTPLEIGTVAFRLALPGAPPVGLLPMQRGASARPVPRSALRSARHPCAGYRSRGRAQFRALREPTDLRECDPQSSGPVRLPQAAWAPH